MAFIDVHSRMLVSAVLICILSSALAVSSTSISFDDDESDADNNDRYAQIDQQRRIDHHQMSATGNVHPKAMPVHDLTAAAGHHHHKKGHGHGKYYQYAKVPKKGAWEFGYKRGNHKHKIERHEKGHKSHFKTKVKWHDKKSKGKGVHIWDYNHHDKKKKKHHG